MSVTVAMSDRKSTVGIETCGAIFLREQEIQTPVLQGHKEDGCCRLSNRVYTPWEMEEKRQCLYSEEKCSFGNATQSCFSHIGQSLAQIPPELEHCREMGLGM